MLCCICLNAGRIIKNKIRFKNSKRYYLLFVSTFICVHCVSAIILSFDPISSYSRLLWLAVTHTGVSSPGARRPFGSAPRPYESSEKLYSYTIYLFFSHICAHHLNASYGSSWCHCQTTVVDCNFY